MTWLSAGVQRPARRQFRRFPGLCEEFENARFGAERDPRSLNDAGLAILSKYRILRTETLLTPHSSVWADLMSTRDTLRVFNNHLHSTAINADDNEYITTRRFLSDTAREVKFRSIVSRLRANSELRAAQVDSISNEIHATHCGRLVCGDFNDTPVSYVYRHMAADLNDAFSECGSGYSHTYRGFFNTLRIDYVLFRAVAGDYPTKCCRSNIRTIIPWWCGSSANPDTAQACRMSKNDPRDYLTGTF